MMTFHYLFICLYLFFIFSISKIYIVFFVLYWRMAYRQQKIFEMHGKVPRPRPIESMALFALFFNFTRMVQCIILVTDVAPWPIFRLIFWDMVWQFGISVFSCYFFGVSQTLAMVNLYTIK